MNPEAPKNKHGELMTLPEICMELHTNNQGCRHSQLSTERYNELRRYVSRQLGQQVSSQLDEFDLMVRWLCEVVLMEPRWDSMDEASRNSSLNQEITPEL